MNAGLQVTHTGLDTTVNAAITTLESTVNSIAAANNASAQADIHHAIAAFDSEILDTTGLFGVNGPVAQKNSSLGYIPHQLVGTQAATTITASGTAVAGATATLTATLQTASGTPLVGKVLSFTLDGAFAGNAITDGTGAATLTGVFTSNPAGTDSAGIVVSFAGDSTNLLSAGTGDLVVTQDSTTTTLTSMPIPAPRVPR